MTYDQTKQCYYNDFHVIKMTENVTIFLISGFKGIVSQKWKFAENVLTLRPCKM